MLIKNDTEYNAIQDGTEVEVYLLGDEWYNLKGSLKCVKDGSILRCDKVSYIFNFAKRNKEGYEFGIIYREV